MSNEKEEWIGKWCWFWNDDGRMVKAVLIRKIHLPDGKFWYVDDFEENRWENCRPVKRDEAEFVK